MREYYVAGDVTPSSWTKDVSLDCDLLKDPEAAVGTDGIFLTTT